MTGWLIFAIALLAAIIVVSLWLGRRLAQGASSDLETEIGQVQRDLRRQTETLSREREELATLMSAISDAILAVDSTGNVMFFNSRFAVLFGGDRLQSQTKPRLGELFRAPEVLNAFQGAFREGASGRTDFRMQPVLDSMLRDFSLSVAPLRKPDGPVYGAVGIFHDVTELKRAEQIRIEFVANVSHELRTPLTSIKGYTDTLLEDVRAGSPAAAAKDFVEAIGRNVDRLMSLIGDLLEISSLESGSDLARDAIETRGVTERVLAALGPRIQERAHVVETSYGAPTVTADSHRLEQVLTNLLENAIKYVSVGGRIQVKWEKSERATLLRVADNGPGIPPEHQPRLFERFYRTDKARSRDLGGTGLGLAIVKHIMEAHGGAVYVMSEPGKGTEFGCRFPD